MNKNKVFIARYFILIDLLDSFSKSEMKDFKHFVASSYFNTDKGVKKLLTILTRDIIGKRAFDEVVQLKVYQELFGKEHLTKNVLPEGQKKFLRAKMSLLTDLAKRFLTIEALDKNLTCKTELLNKALLDKRQFLLFNRLLKKNKKILREHQPKEIKEYALDFQLEFSHMNYLYQQGVILKEDNFPALIKSLDTYYLLNKLKFYSTICSIMNVTPKSYDLEALEVITPLLDLPIYANNPLIILYRSIIQLMQTHQEVNYLDLLNLLNKYESFIPKNYLIDFYNVACNFCARQIRLGKVNYHREVFELYKKMNIKQLLIETDFIQITKLKNVVSLSAQIGEFEWAVGIINKYCHFVKKEERTSVYHFNLGVIEFYKTNYKLAISHFIRVEKLNLMYDLDAKILLLKSYYLMDREYDERTLQIFRSAERFVLTNKSMPIAHKKSYKNFIQILINLYRARHGVGKRTLESIQEKMEKMDFITDKKWLLIRFKEMH